MSFTEKIIDRTKQLEALLRERGGGGRGLHELATSLELQLDPKLVRKLRFIATVRNKTLHEAGYRFLENERDFFSQCDAAIAEVSGLSSTEAVKRLALARNEAASSASSKELKPHRKWPARRSRQAWRVPSFIKWAFIGLFGWWAVIFYRPAFSAIIEGYTKARKQSDKVAAQPSSPVYASVTEAQKAAVRIYPQLGVEGSPFHSRFLALHEKYRKEKPGLFQKNEWPLEIAHEVASQK